jgi:thiol-disulfide isomerase/thioredoxin
VSKRKFFIAGAVVFATAVTISGKIYLNQTSLPQWHGQPMPAFTMRTVDGHVLTNSDLLGRVVVLDFGSTWCPPCNELSKFLDGVNASSRQNGLKVIWADMGEFVKEPVKKDLPKLKKPYTVTIENNKLAGSLGVQGMPTVFVLDRRGNVRDTLVGFDDFITPWRINRDISSLLAEPSAAD